MQDITAYVNECVRQGFSKPEIRAGLVSAGWEASVIEQAFPVQIEASEQALPVQIEVPDQTLPSPISIATTSTEAITISAHRRLPTRLIKTVVGMSAVITAFSGVTVMAEHGYLPAISKVYRATSLPLLWGGTTGNSDIAVGKMILATTQDPGAETIGNLSLTVQASAGAAHVSLQKVPLLAAILTPKPINALADIAPGSAGNELSVPSGGISPEALSPETLLPVAINFSSVSARDSAGDLKLTLSMDLGDLAAKLAPLAGQVTNMAIPKKITADGLLIRTTKKAYLRSNLIPYLTPADTNKWLNFDVPDDILAKTEQQTLAQSYPKDTLTQYRILLKKTLKDDGIVRKNGEALAKYEITLDPSVLTKLAKDPALKDQAADLESAAQAKSTLHVTFWTEPQRARLRFVELTASTIPDAFGVTATITLNEEVRYKLSEAITTPPQAEIISQPGIPYLEQVSNQVMGNNSNASLMTPSEPLYTDQLQSTHLEAANTQRKRDLNSLRVALLNYSKNGDGHFPSTGGKMELLDSTSSTLARLGSNKFTLKMPLVDPLPSKYHYGYTSDGKTFRAICVITSNTDATTIAQTYIITDTATALVTGLQQ